jgi:hypothetical protein
LHTRTTLASTRLSVADSELANPTRRAQRIN